MGVKHSQKYCSGCEKNTLHVAEQNSSNVALHALLVVLTLGFWIPIWIVFSMSSGLNNTMKASHCTQCGEKTTPVVGRAVCAIILVVILLLIFA